MKILTRNYLFDLKVLAAGKDKVTIDSYTLLSLINQVRSYQDDEPLYTDNRRNLDGIY